MSNKFLNTLFLFISIICLGQKETYVTYYTESNEHHELEITNDSITYRRLYRHSLSPEYKFTYEIKKLNDTIFVLNAKNNKVNLITESNLIPKEPKNQFYIRKSKSELYFPVYRRPYFRKEYVDSLIGKSIIFFVNGKMYNPATSDSIFLNNKIMGNKKIKKRQTKFIKGKEAFDKYGVFGLNGIIEINNEKIIIEEKK